MHGIFLNKNLVFIDSMQFMNSSIENLELLKQKGDYPYKYMNSFERFHEQKLPAKKYFHSSPKDGKIGDDG